MINLETTKKKAYLFANYHHKNQPYLNWYCDSRFELVTNLEDADIVFSASNYVQIEKYANKIFIFGPHFSVFPNQTVRRFNNLHKNAVYIQPSQPSVSTWQNEFGFKTLPIKAIPFGIDTNKFTNAPLPPQRDLDTNGDRSKLVMVYFKDRDPSEFKFIVDFLAKNNIGYKVFDYRKRYTETDYLNFLRNAKYGIWLGCHESQGFGLQEALSCNVPLLVWNVRLRKQQWSYREHYKNIKSEVTTIPYWDERCGEYFYEQKDFVNTFERFTRELRNYQPRQFVLDHLSMEKCAERWDTLLNELTEASSMNKLHESQ